MKKEGKFERTLMILKLLSLKRKSQKREQKRPLYSTVCMRSWEETGQRTKLKKRELTVKRAVSLQDIIVLIWEETACKRRLYFNCCIAISGVFKRLSFIIFKHEWLSTINTTGDSLWTLYFSMNSGVLHYERQIFCMFKFDLFKPTNLHVEK